MPGWRSGRGHRTIEHLQGRENSLEPFAGRNEKPNGSPWPVYIAAASSHPGTTLLPSPDEPLAGLSIRPNSGHQRVCRRRQPAGPDSVPDLQPADLPVLGHRGQPPPPGGFGGNPPPAPARARLRARASRLALAADRAGEGPCLRGARDRTTALAVAGVSGSGGGGPAPLPAQVADRIGTGPGCPRLRRSGIRDCHGVALLVVRTR